ncbi:MAG: hypothetical protein J6O40_02460, partial [Ruminococcus sp.]|nr:hypothetical protein [Ruminococcus sp.]
NENENEKDTEKETEKEEDFTKVYLSKKELSDLVGLADRLTIDSYICKIKDWQMKNRKLNTKPYISIKKWLSEDGAVREYKYSRDPVIEEFERYADSIDFSTLST